MWGGVTIQGFLSLYLSSIHVVSPPLFCSVCSVLFAPGSYFQSPGLFAIYLVVGDDYFFPSITDPGFTSDTVDTSATREVVIYAL